MREAPATTGSPSHLVTRLCRFAAVTRHENALRRLLRPGTSSNFARSGLRSGRGCIQNTVHTHGYTRTRGARRRSHRTHARAATADRTHRDRPSTRLKSTPAASEHIACLCGLGQASHSTDASTAVYSPLPLPTPRAPNAQSADLTSHSALLPPVSVHPSKGYTRRASTSMHAQTQTIPASIHRNSAARTAARKICTMAASAAARRKAHEQKKPQRAGPPPGSSV